MGSAGKMLMGGGGKSDKPVVTQTPQKTAMTANKPAAEKKNPVSANMEDRRRQASTKQRSTVMTGGKGLTEPAKTQKKELLGS